MLVSVITACYNSEKTIRKTFESMLHQSCQNFEYIIVDGGSTDNTVNIIKEYLPRFDGKMQYTSEPDKGIYDAMNKGIARCSGDLIGIVNSDDWYEPDTLENVIRGYQGNKYEVIYGLQRSIKEGKEASIVFYHHQFLPQKMITHPTCFVTRETYNFYGVFNDKEYRSSADYELMLRFYYTNNVVFTPIYKILSNFTLGGISSNHVGQIETAKLKRQLGLMSRKKYWITIIKNKISYMLGNTWDSR